MAPSFRLGILARSFWRLVVRDVFYALPFTLFLPCSQIRREFLNRIELGIERFFHPIAFFKDGICVIFKIFFHLKLLY